VLKYPFFNLIRYLVINETTQPSRSVSRRKQPEFDGPSRKMDSVSSRKFPVLQQPPRTSFVQVSQTGNIRNIFEDRNITRWLDTENNFFREIGVLVLKVPWNAKINFETKNSRKMNLSFGFVFSLMSKASTISHNLLRYRIYARAKTRTWSFGSSKSFLKIDSFRRCRPSRQFCTGRSDLRVTNLPTTFRTSCRTSETLG
jgi:hypothetical protein